MSRLLLIGVNMADILLKAAFESSYLKEILLLLLEAEKKEEKKAAFYVTSYMCLGYYL